MNLVEKIYQRNEKREQVLVEARIRKPIPMKSKLMDGKKNLIIEYKRQSPSGFSDPVFRNVQEFGQYAEKFADAFSILTEPAHFLGNYQYGIGLQNYNKPILMKDFVDRESMIESGYKSGFDAVLLIADFLSGEKLEQLSEYAASLHMDVLIEFHDLINLERIPTGENVMCGYNRRDLKTLAMDGREGEALDLMLDRDVRVLESGINRENYEIFLKMPFQAYLIGTSVLKEPEFLMEIKKRGK
ncbi:MAG: beta/alpha barrel domain-containing protein [Cuniculiplasma sp.]